MCFSVQCESIKNNKRMREDTREKTHNQTQLTMSATVTKSPRVYRLIRSGYRTGSRTIDGQQRENELATDKTKQATHRVRQLHIGWNRVIKASKKQCSEKKGACYSGSPNSNKMLAATKHRYTAFISLWLFGAARTREPKR